MFSCPYKTLSTRCFFIILATIALMLLAAGLTLGELANLHPCHLCSVQRLFYILVFLTALCGALFIRRPRLCAVLVALSAAGGLAAAIKQSWMQYAPQDAVECGFGDPTLLEQLISWLGVQWPAMFMVTGFCTQKEWIFLGLSMANWSLICFAGLLCVAVWIFFRRNPKQ